MIKHTRKATPPLFDDQFVKDLKFHDLEFYAQPANHRSQKRRKTIESNIDIEYEIEEILTQEFHHKCAYCEQSFQHSKISKFNSRFRPNNFAMDMKGEVDAADHYFWLMYEWKNIYLSCTECSNHKSNYFPVEKNRATLKTKYNQLDKKEKRLIIDPAVDDPEKHFYYTENGSIESRTIEGNNSIEIFKLNRRRLITARKKAHLSLKKILTNPEKLKNYIQNELHKEKEFIGLKRYFIKNHIKFSNQKLSKKLLDQLNYKSFVAQEDLVEEVAEESNVPYATRGISLSGKSSKKASKPKPSPKRSSHSEFIKLEEIYIKNFKNITDVHIRFPSKEKLYTDIELSTKNLTKEHADWTFFLGENGSGKSSILQAITLCLAGEEKRNALNLNPADYLQYGKRKCTIELTTNMGNYKLSITPKTIKGTVEGCNTFVIAYGSTRLMTIDNFVPEQDHNQRIKIANLFNPTAGLVNARKWLLKLNERDFDQVAIVLKDVLNLSKKYNLKDEEGNIFRKDNEIYFKEPGKQEMALRSVSDGYKILIAMVCDICITIHTVFKSKTKHSLDYEHVYGIVLIDELGNHLHPRWKMRIVNALRHAFKRLQFVISSHEPLCLRGLVEDEVRVVEYQNNDVTVLDNLPDPSTYRVDQILTSPFFGLYSIVDPAEEKLFTEYYELLRKDESDRSPADVQTIKKLANQVREFNVMGNSLREELAYYAIDQYLANQKEEKLKWDDLKEKTKESVLNIWEENKAIL